MSSPTPRTFSLASLDGLIAQQPWLPRALPYLLYVLLLGLVQKASNFAPWLYSPLYVIQCGLVGWLLWRYRKLLPELTVSFHWLAIPASLLVVVSWICLGRWMISQWPEQFAQTEPHLFESMTPATKWLSLSLRLLGMSLLVPLFEELFMRSLLLRAFHSGKQAYIGMVQFACDLPVIGDLLMNTQMAERAQTQDPVFEKQLLETPLGKPSIFGVMASTLIFALGHTMRDWPAAVVCGVLFCVLLRLTARKGLGPVIWAHGLTNALLFIYCVKTGDWQFM